MIPTLHLAGVGATAGGASGAVPHRYWRLYVTENNGNAYVSVQTLKMRDAPAGTDHALSKTYFGNDAQFTLEPSRAFDNNNSTVWATNVFPGWCGVDFGATQANWKAIIEMVVRADIANQAPKTFKLQSSDDNSAWSDVITVTAQTAWSQGEERTFSAA